MIWRYCCLVFIFHGALSADSFWQVSTPGGFSAEAKLVKDAVLLPQSIVIELQLSHPVGYSVDEKALLANLLRNPSPGASPFGLKSVNKSIVPSSNGGLITELWQLNLEPKLAGKYGLTFLNITFLPEGKMDEKIVQLFSGLLEVTVNLPKIEEHLFFPNEMPLSFSQTFPITINSHLRTELRQKHAEDEPNRNLARWINKKFPWEAATILLCLLLGFIFYQFGLIKKRAIKSSLFAKDHYRQADKKLKLLKLQSPPDPLLAKDFITELSHAVRMQIEEEYKLTVLPETTEGFFAKIEPIDFFKGEKLVRFKTLIELFDRVKFAAHTPSLEECLAARADIAEIFAHNVLTDEQKDN